jgi:hypothetical protein
MMTNREVFPVITHNPFGMAGAMLGPDGRIQTGYGLQGREPSPGFDVCPNCEGHGELETRSLVHNMCGRCKGTGQVVKV